MTQLIKSDFGGCWEGLIVTATPNQLIAALGDPHYICEYEGRTKTSMEWQFAFGADDTTYFAIYDMREYGHYPKDHRDDVYDFHIGVKNSYDHQKIRKVLEERGLSVKMSENF
jgi:hypothetical protein